MSVASVARMLVTRFVYSWRSLSLRTETGTIAISGSFGSARFSSR